MKHCFITFLCLLIAIAVNGASPDGVNYQKMTIGSDTYTITCDWLEPNILNDDTQVEALPTDFIVVNDVIYYIKRNEKTVGLASMEYYDPTKDERGLIQIDDTDVEIKPAAFYFIGADSEGTPYFSSFASHKWSESNPFTISPFEINGGKVKVTKVINLNLIDDWFTDEVWISGSLKDDNFRVVARIKKGDDVKSLKTYGYAEWKYDGSEKSKNPVAYASHPFSAGIGQPIEDNKVIIYDAAMPYDEGDNAKYTYTKPTMCTMNTTGNTDMLSEFDGKTTNDHGTGLDIVKYDGRYFMLYGSGFAPTSYGVACLPDYPNSLSSSTHMWTLGTGKIPYSDAEESLSSFYKHDAKPMAIHADKDMSDGLKFYTLTNHRGVAKYTIRKDSFSVGLTEIRDEAKVEYFSIEGFKLSERPTEKGVYICRKGNTTTKIFVK